MARNDIITCSKFAEPNPGGVTQTSDESDFHTVSRHLVFRGSACLHPNQYHVQLEDSDAIHPNQYHVQVEALDANLLLKY
jgi:hypothetical protein